MKIALAQLNPLVGDLRGNAKKIIDASKEAAKLDVTLIITPELSLWGYPPRDLLLDQNRYITQDKVLNELSYTLGKETPNLFLLIGIAEPATDNQLPKLFNSIALVSDGKWEVVARKQLLPTYDVFDERRYFRSANTTNFINLKTTNKNWKIGLTICEDLWVEERLQGQRIQGPNPINQLLDDKVDLLLNLSASPFGNSKEFLRQKLAAKAAEKLNCPVIYINQVGANDELIFDGSSFVMGPDGQVILSLPQCAEYLGVWDTNKTTKLDSSILISPQERLFQSLVLGIKDYCAKCGFTTALIGLSGGIDSALVAAIATASLGPQNVRAILMPSPWSSQSSIDDALELANRLGVKTNTIPIKDLMKSFDLALSKPLEEVPQGLTAENLQSRIRGTLLMAIANQRQHLLLSTGNKSEFAMGYCTLYGDMNGGLSVIGDLYKTSVFELCQWLDSEDSYKCRKSFGLENNGDLIGQQIRTKAPSAELRPDQLDTDSLPEYELLDPILKDLIENRLNTNDLIQKGYDKDLIENIQSLLKKAEFKRRQAPPLLKVSDQAFGSGWRIPIASK